ncbi:MAG: thiamine pyrophosphate-dependent enzyme [Planctomycetota bacterium]|jgi:pyruvate dehydrogenase E1 component alpha subunit
MDEQRKLEEIFRKMCLIRYFELQVAEAVKSELIPGPVYLSVGQEAISATISTLTKNYAVFTQHRGHSAYLAYGGDIETLRDELLGLSTGCCGGRGGSPCVQDLDIPMYGHHGLIGENIPIATGYALASGRPTVAYFGDAASEEDYSLPSFGFASTHKLPVLYVCEDNNLSILTPIDDRRSWNVYDVTSAMGLKSAAIPDDPKVILKTVKELLKELPAFVNIHTCRHLWHVGVGTDGPPERDRIAEMRDIVPNSGEIEDEIQTHVRELWQKQSQKL